MNNRSFATTIGMTRATPAPPNKRPRNRSNNSRWARFCVLLIKILREPQVESSGEFRFSSARPRRSYIELQAMGAHACKVWIRRNR